ncbi:MAG TPA: isocitrate lyase/phosphoenolpyruvate mutase family protein [Trebonia sp.]
MTSPASPLVDLGKAPSARQRAAALRALHVPGHPLVLPNAWDAASATMVIDAGFPAIATSSAATASVLGYADSEATPVEEVLAAAARIVRAVSVPVTVDFERGYRLPAAELAERLTSTGAVGLNLEGLSAARAGTTLPFGKIKIFIPNGSVFHALIVRILHVSPGSGLSVLSCFAGFGG